MLIWVAEACIKTFIRMQAAFHHHSPITRLPRITSLCHLKSNAKSPRLFSFPGDPLSGISAMSWQLRPDACQEWTLEQVSGRASVVKTVIAVIFSPSIYRKQTLPSCSLPVAKNRQSKQMSRDAEGVLWDAASLKRKQTLRRTLSVGVRGEGNQSA